MRLSAQQDHPRHTSRSIRCSSQWGSSAGFNGNPPPWHTFACLRSQLGSRSDYLSWCFKFNTNKPREEGIRLFCLPKKKKAYRVTIHESRRLLICAIQPPQSRACPYLPVSPCLSENSSIAALPVTVACISQGACIPPRCTMMRCAESRALFESAKKESQPLFKILYLMSDFKTVLQQHSTTRPWTERSFLILQVCRNGLMKNNYERINSFKTKTGYLLVKAEWALRNGSKFLFNFLMTFVHYVPTRKQ